MHLLLYSKKGVLFFCGAKHKTNFSLSCDLTIDFCFFHHALVFLFFCLLLFLFHRTLVFFVSSPQKSPLRDFKRNSSLCSLLRYTHTHRYIERVSRRVRERQTTRKLLVLLALIN